MLADHIGVTKASVSKWERGQSLPDAPVLAELASFFGVTLDELVSGYEPQLGREQIRRIYRELARTSRKALCRGDGRLPPLYPPLRQLLAVPAADGGAAAQPRAARPHAGGTADALMKRSRSCRRVRERCSATLALRPTYRIRRLRWR